MKRHLVWIAVLAHTALSVPSQADTFTRGQEISASFLRGDADAVWAEMTPEMQHALGSAGALTAVRDDLLRSFGEEKDVLSEQTVRQGTYDIYERTARWTESPNPVQIVVTFDQSERIAGFRVRPLPAAAPSQHLNYETKATLRLPVDGSWYVYWGGREIEDNYHAADAGQRFAMDLLVMQDGRSHSGDPAVLENYHCWDRPILAPGDGMVARAVDGLPDQPIGSADPANPAGNHVVIDFGNEEYGFLAHLRAGSVRVVEGASVTAGTEIGRCGNSGNTSEPHLHFHLQTSPRLGAGDGLPAQFLSYRADGTLIKRGEPRRGQSIQAVD